MVLDDQKECESKHDCLIYNNDNDKRQGWDVEKGENVIKFIERFNNGKGRPKKFDQKKTGKQTQSVTVE